MDDNLYDEFGNYIGPELGDSSEEEDSDDEEEEEEEEEEGDGDGEVGQLAFLLVHQATETRAVPHVEPIQAAATHTGMMFGTYAHRTSLVDASGVNIT